MALASFGGSSWGKTAATDPVSSVLQDIIDDPSCKAQYDQEPAHGAGSTWLSSIKPENFGWFVVPDFRDTWRRSSTDNQSLTSVNVKSALTGSEDCSIPTGANPSFRKLCTGHMVSLFDLVSYNENTMGRSCPMSAIQLTILRPRCRGKTTMIAQLVRLQRSRWMQ